MHTPTVTCANCKQPIVSVNDLYICSDRAHLILSQFAYVALDGRCKQPSTSKRFVFLFRGDDIDSHLAAYAVFTIVQVVLVFHYWSVFTFLARSFALGTLGSIVYEDLRTMRAYYSFVKPLLPGSS